MNSLIRTVAMAIVAALLALGNFALRFACAPGDNQGLLRESRREEELRELQRVTLHRKGAQRQAVQVWIARRRSLAEIMHCFQELDREFGQLWPPYHALVTLLPNLSPVFDEERHYQIIRIYVETIQHGRPEELAPTLRRLERDYQQFQTDKRKPRP